MLGLWFFSYSFAQAATGFLALDEGAIPVKNASGVYLDTITLAGSRLVAAGEHGVVIYSEDDGVTWRQADVPVDATITSLAFSSPGEGWAVGDYGVILHTTDGGATWRAQLNGLQVNQLTLAAATQAVAMHNNALGTPNAVRRAQIFIHQGPNKPFMSVLALSKSQIIAFGADRMTMRSDDGGVSWYDESLAIGDPVSHNLYDAQLTGSGINVVGEAGMVFRSTDGGLSFPAVASPSDATLFGTIEVGKTILAYGVAGTLVKSDDDGKSWQKVSIPTTSNLIAAVILKSGALLLATEGGAVFLSRDGGLTFQATEINLPMAIYDLVQDNQGDVVTVGTRGVMKIAAGLLH